MSVARHVVPEGLNDGSQAIYCLESVSEEIRPVGHGMMSGCWYRSHRSPDSDGYCDRVCKL
jgi:hypothetical protein